VKRLNVLRVSFLGCDITAKAEHLNPGGSVKDRAALYLIKEAEENGLYYIAEIRVIMRSVLPSLIPFCTQNSGLLPHGSKFCSPIEPKLNS